MIEYSNGSKRMNHVCRGPNEVNPAESIQPRRESRKSRMKMESSLPTILPKNQPGVSAGHIPPTTIGEINIRRKKTHMMPKPKIGGLLIAKALI
jgi:hypothetical protein